MRHVWYPLQGQFEHLHPEYEVLDWRGRIANAELNRETSLQALGFRVFSFACDDVAQHNAASNVVES
ncbi:hypothetical protein [Paenibacillus aestuarii]|uniref:Uncharacterized protein n=1 Tax=Paenibacillus aestuarii TaxID=516965 RepID=A0ABW0KDS0_9BACL